MLKPIPLIQKLDLNNLPAITFGAGSFSGRYNNDEPIDVSALVSRAYQLGIRAFDSSPYYGDSETLLGHGLRDLMAAGARREELYIMTKCGRMGPWDFDYSPTSIRNSVKRSCQRLSVAHLDVVYMHDVEFVRPDEVYAAASELFKLKQEGVIGYVGMSGYPLQILEYLATEISKRLQPLDIVLSYSNFNIQNTALRQEIPRLRAAGVQAVSNASPLSMGLLREAGPPEWHPASTTLKENVTKAVEILKGSDFPMADVALGHALRHASAAGIASTVIGFCTIDEIEEAVRLYWHVTAEDTQGVQQRDAIEEKVKGILGSSVDETWPSPPRIEDLEDPTEREAAVRCLMK